MLVRPDRLMIPQVSGRYSPGAAVFDGSSDFLSLGASFNSNAAPVPATGTLFFYIKRTTTNRANIITLSDDMSGNYVTVVQAPSTNVLTFRIGNGSVLTACSWTTASAIPNDGKYHSVLFTFLDDGLLTTPDLKIDGAFADGSGTASGSLTIDYNLCDTNSIGAAFNSTNHFHGGLGLLWFGVGSTLDYTDFCNPDNSPKRLAANGVIGGSSPWIWLPGTGNDFATNAAPGGVSFVVNGSLDSEVLNT